MRSRTISFAAVVALWLGACSPAAPPCAATCQGCCDAMGQCQLGTISNACGIRGDTCKSCSVTESCQFGSCMSFFNGSGGGSSGVGGGSSPVGGGSSSVGGGSSSVGGGSSSVGGGSSSVGGGSSSVGGGSSSVGGGSSSVGGGSSSVGGGSSSVGGGSSSVGGGSSSVGGGSSSVGGGSSSVGGGTTVVPGDTCVNALAMTPISSTQFTATADLTPASDHSSGTCGGAGRDLAFSFTVPQLSDVSFTITSLGGSGTPVGYILRSSCAEEQRCHSGTSASPIVRLVAGSYRLIVDAASTTAVGSFTATVTLSTPAPLVGDTCSSGEVLSLSGGSATATGTTAGYGSDYTPSLCSASGGDRFYWLTLSSPVNLTATVTPTNSSTRLMVALLGPTTAGSCSSAPEAVCNSATSPGSTTSVTRQGLAAGTYFLVVKGVSGLDGPFSLAVTTTSTSIPGDSCSSAVPLAFIGGSASASGTTLNAGNDRSATCSSAGTSGDVVYSFTANAGDVLTASVTPGSSWRPILSLSNGGTCSGSGELICGAAASSGGSTSFTSPALAAGTYYLWVDSVSGFGGGPFTLQASRTTSSTGESCVAPTPLNFIGGTANASGATSLAINDNTTSSICTSVSGADQVFSFNGTAGQILDVVVTPTSTFRPAIVLRGNSSTCSSASELRCIAGTASGSQVFLSAVTLPSSGPYFLWVDGVSGSAGSYSLQATLSGGATGDTCASPIPLSFSSGTFGTATASGSTATASADRTSNTCGGDGGDRVYSFSISTNRTFTATISPSGTHNPVLALTGPSSSCSTALELTCVGGNVALGTLSRALTPGTYYLWVDSYSMMTGTYTLTATLN